MAVSAAILAHAPAAFLSLKSPLNRNRPRDKNRTKNAEKPPFQAVFLRKMVGVRGLEPRASRSQSKRATPGYEVVRRSGRILLNCAILSHMELENSMGIQTSSAVLDWSMCWYMQDWIFISIPLSSPEKYPLPSQRIFFCNSSSILAAGALPQNSAGRRDSSKTG